MKKKPAKKTAAKSAKKIVIKKVKKPAGKFMVVCSYPGYSFEIDEKIRKAAGYSDGSGCGLTLRDHSWYGLTDARAKAKAKKLKATKIKGLKVYVEKDGEF